MKDEKDVIDADFTCEDDNLPSVDTRSIVDVEFEYARENLINILETSHAVLDNTAELALDSDHPRMIEVYSGLITSLATINKTIFDIREKKMKIKGELIDTDNVPVGTTITNNNAIFVGSTEELLKKMEG